MEETRTDRSLLTQIRDQRADAFDVLFARYQQPMRRHIYGVVKDTMATEDLLQELFLRVWTRAEQWDGRGAVRGWLYRIATNLSLNHLRAVRRRPQQPLEPPANPLREEGVPETPSWMIDSATLQPDVLIEIDEEMQRLQHIIADLPHEKQEVIRMVYDDEMDLRSVAEELGVPEGTIKSRLYYSRRQLIRAWSASS